MSKITYERVKEFLERFPRIQIGGRPVSQSISYNGLSYYDLIPSIISATTIDLVRYINADGDSREFYFQQLPTSIKTQIKYGDPSAFLFIIIRIGRDIYESIRTAITYRREASKNRSGQPDPASGKKIIMVVSQSMYWKPDQNGYFRQYPLGEVLVALSKTYEIIGIETPYRFDERSKNRLQFKEMQWFMQSEFIGISDIAKALLYTFFAIPKYSLLFWKVNRASVNEDAVFRSLFELSKFEIIRYCFSALFTFILYHSANKNLLRKKSPLAALVLYETGPFEKIFIRACREERVKTVGIMHGIIHPYHLDYNRKYVDIEAAMIPDCTFVWGEYANRVLTEMSNYPRSSVTVTGNLAPSKKKNGQPYVPPKESIGRKTVGVISTSYPYSELTEEKAYLYHKDLYEYATVNESVELIIKLHPGEPITIHNRLRKEYPSGRIQVHRNMDSAMFFESSDIIVGITYSTMLYDALRWKKRLFVCRMTMISNMRTFF